MEGEDAASRASQYRSAEKTGKREDRLADSVKNDEVLSAPRRSRSQNASRSESPRSVLSNHVQSPPVFLTLSSQSEDIFILRVGGGEVKLELS